MLSFIFKASEDVEILIFPMRGIILFCSDLFFFFLERFSFAAGIYLLSLAFSFCRDLFQFCRKYFPFATGFFFSPLPFLFCREHFSFAASISVLPPAFFFCRKLFSLVVTLVGHRIIEKRVEAYCFTKNDLLYFF